VYKWKKIYPLVFKKQIEQKSLLVTIPGVAAVASGSSLLVGVVVLVAVVVLVGVVGPAGDQPAMSNGKVKTGQT
jgi:hypothetical protein